MKREYPQKMFWLFVLTNFLFHFFYLSVPGIILCIVGIWIKACLYIGCAVLGLDLILSIVEQSRIRNAAVSHSENPEFNELMDSFCSPDGLQQSGKYWMKRSNPPLMMNLKKEKTNKVSFDSSLVSLWFHLSPLWFHF